MLYPIESKTRELKNLDGVWKVAYDSEREGVNKGFANGIPVDSEETAVPSSLNELAADRKKYLHMDWVWYSTQFRVPGNWRNRSVYLRFGAVNFRAEVFLNGIRLGMHEGGYLPFEFELDENLLNPDQNVLVVRVDNLLDETTIPQGNLPPVGGVSEWRVGNFPDVHYDFFPYTGIHRSVVLYSTDNSRIEGIRITTVDINKGLNEADVLFMVNFKGEEGSLEIKIPELGYESSVALGESKSEISKAELSSKLKAVEFWCPEHPKLYDIQIDYLSGGKLKDQYLLPFGFRKVEIEDGTLKLNGEKIYLKGFGKHEDLSVIGKGLNLPFMIKDFNLLKWIGANSFRTSHYPYSEEMMMMADRQGLLVIDETAANTLSMKAVVECKKREILMKNHKDHVSDLINRDYNHPCVIMWSLGNECETYFEEGKGYFRELVRHAKTLDGNRPVMFVVNSWGHDDFEADSFDLIGVNIYPAWYQEPGKLDEYLEEGFIKQVDVWRERFPEKPVIITECGADAIPGLHDVHSLMWTQEFQVEMLERILDLADQRNWVQGVHPWAFADFRVGQHQTRVAFNWKGIFTRDRCPKPAAHMLRKRWL